LNKDKKIKILLREKKNIKLDQPYLI